MWQPERSQALEIMDLGNQYYSPQEYESCLKYLGKVNRLLGGFKATERAFKALNISPQTVLEVGCGGGYLCVYLQRLFPQSEFLGIDLSQEAISHAYRHLPKPAEKRIKFAVQKNKCLEFEEDAFDVVTTILVCHHMTEEELVQFLKDAYRISSKAVIINDIHRHWLAYIGFSLLAPFAFPNRLIWHDGRTSVKRAFRREDWVKALKQAGFEESQWTLTWNWLFRWTLTLRKI